MPDTEIVFEEAIELMRIGKQNESVTLLRKVASIGHFQAIQIVNHIDYIHGLAKQFAVNPLSIVVDDELNRDHILKDLVYLYERDIVTNLSRLQTINNGLIPEDVTELLIFQTIDNLIEYRNKSLGALPNGVIPQLKQQIIKAFSSVYIDRGYMSQIIENYESELMLAIWEFGIEEKTLNYMEKLDSKYFRNK